MTLQADIEAHYDEGHDFFALFLDDEYRVYTSAVWGEATTLDEAQVAKLARICNFANVQPNQRVIDVGCGFGGLMKYITKTYKGTKAHGVTLSSSQAEYINLVKAPNVSVNLCSWEDYVPTEKYDAIVSVCALEHFSRLEDNLAGTHRDIFKKFFDWCLDVSTPDAQIGIQSIVITRPPKNINELRASNYLREKVFPGASLSSVSDIQAAIVDKYEIKEATRIGPDYVLTLEAWKKNLIRNKKIVLEKYSEALFDHYITYFDSAICCFSEGYWDVFQASLKRATSPKVLPK